MFTGIVERTATVVSRTSGSQASSAAASMATITQLVLDPGPGFETMLGDSVAVNGCCLTVTRHAGSLLAFDVTGETLDKTSLGLLTAGSEVNLERALRVGDRLGGHIVSGHVDGTGLVQRLAKKTDGWELTVSMSPTLGRYCIPKGSICLDGISLTLNTVDDGDQAVSVSIRLIPTTVNLTTFKHLAEGQKINIEVDNIGKYVERLVKPFA